MSATSDIRPGSRKSFGPSVRFSQPWIALGQAATERLDRTSLREEEAAGVPEELYRQSFDTHPQPMWIFDAASLRCLASNAAAAAFSGHSAEELRAMSLQSLFDGQCLTSALLDPAGVEVPCICRRKGGPDVEAQIATRRLQAKGLRMIMVTIVATGQPPGGDGLGSNPGESLVGHSELARQLRELTDANRELASFLRTVAHDLRSPLRSIGGFARLLAEQLSHALDDETRSYVRRIDAGVTRMSGLISDLLAHSHGARDLGARSRIDLSALAADIVEELRSAEPQRRIVVEIEPDLIDEGDLALVRTLMTNLIGNAWKFTSRKDDGHVVIGASAEGSDRSFFVRDNGIGFDMADAERMFGERVRLPNAAGFEGFGIGLASAQRIVRQHGGRIWAQAAPDRGSTFHFTLS